jgi:hypothetical protein
MKEIKLPTPSGRSVLFTDAVDSSGNEDVLIIAGWGTEHTGKSRFGVTGGGDGIAGIIPTDRKTRHSVRKTAEEFNKRILIPKEDFVRESIKGVRVGWSTEEKNDAEIEKITKESKLLYRKFVNQVKETAWALYDHNEVDVIQIDSFTHFYLDMTFAHYGRLGHVVKRIGTKLFKSMDEAKKETADFIDSISGKHLILMNQNTPEYVNNVATGNDIWKGYPDLGFKCNLQIEMTVNKKFNPAKSDDPNLNWHWGLSIIRSLHKPELEGEAGRNILTDEMISFENLKMLVLEN